MRSGNGHPRTIRARPAWASHLSDAGQPAEPEAGQDCLPAWPPPEGAGWPPPEDGWYEGRGAEANGADGMVLRLCLLRRAGEVMLAVIDASDDAPTPRQPDWVRESGRGLQIIDALSSVWGWSPIDGHGKAVWAVLPQALRDQSARLTRGPGGPRGILAERGQPRAAASG